MLNQVVEYGEIVQEYGQYNVLGVNKGFTVSVGKQMPVDYYTGSYTSDDLAIQAAIDYVDGLGGGTVLIREGVYVITSTINITGIN